METGSVLISALSMILSFDRELYSIAYNSLYIAIFSTFFAALAAVPLGTFLAFYDFSAKKILVTVFNSLMSLPTVVVGLLVYALISRSGPLGSLGLLFTPAGIIVGQSILVFPILVSLVYGGLNSLDIELKETLVSFGAKRRQILLKTVMEARSGVAIAILSGFGRVIGEVGISMMLGGNIRWYTRTFTTAMALETSKGDFGLSLALGLILMIIAFSVNFVLFRLFTYEK